MKAIPKIRKLIVIAKQCAQRLKFAKDHINWDPAQWYLVIWCDEPRINRLGSERRIWLA
ncbi:unnamed protein product, partial [Ceratitis capitata]